MDRPRQQSRAARAINIRIVEDADGVHVTTSLPPAPVPEPDPLTLATGEQSLNPMASPLSPTTLAVMRILARESHWVTADTISQELQIPLERKLQPLLADLVERGWLEARTGPGGGYMLSIPDDVDPDTYRRRAVVWLDVVEFHLAGVDARPRPVRRAGQATHRPGHRPAPAHAPRVNTAAPTPEEIARRAAEIRAENLRRLNGRDEGEEGEQD